MGRRRGRGLGLAEREVAGWEAERARTGRARAAVVVDVCPCSATNHTADEQHERDQGDLKGTGDLGHLPLVRQFRRES